MDKMDLDHTDCKDTVLRLCVVTDVSDKILKL